MKGSDVLLVRGKSDEWETPQHIFDPLHREFNFTLDAAASHTNHKCPNYLCYPERDAFKENWYPHRCWLNPPYSMLGAFMRRAAAQVALGALVVALVPARTDTKWFHAVCWDETTNARRPGVELRFIKGRLRFLEDGVPSKNSAPFPSMIVILRPAAY